MEPTVGTDVLPTLLQRIPEGVAVAVAIVFTILHMRDRRFMTRSFVGALERLEDRQDERAKQVSAALDKVADKLDGFRKAKAG